MALPWRKSKPPKGWEEIEKVVLALDAESREVLAESHLGKRKVETMWPVHQLNNQRSRYLWDMYHRYKRIDRRLYDWCVKHKLVDAPLVAKWKKPGYERLCSTYVINPKNFNFGTTSICRVPRQNLASTGRVVVGNTTGCLGCASGPGGYHNIFGNKYGQNLADVQMCRERGRLREVGAWSEEEAEEAWRARGGGSGKKRSRLELLALEPSGEVWATEEEERAMLLAKQGGGGAEAAPGGAAGPGGPGAPPGMQAGAHPGMAASSAPGMAAGPPPGMPAGAHPGVSASSAPGMAAGPHPGMPAGVHPGGYGAPAAGHGGRAAASLPAVGDFGVTVPAAAQASASSSGVPGSFGVYDGMSMGGFTAVLNAHTHNTGAAEEEEENAEAAEAGKSDGEGDGAAAAAATEAAAAAAEAPAGKRERPDADGEEAEAAPEAKEEAGAEAGTGDEQGAKRARVAADE